MSAAKALSTQTVDRVPLSADVDCAEAASILMHLRDQNAALEGLRRALETNDIHSCDPTLPPAGNGL